MKADQEAFRLGGRERVEAQDGGPASRRHPVGAYLEEVGSGQAQEQDRPAHGEHGEVLDELEEHRLGPVEVVEDDDDGPLVRDGFDEAAE